MRRRSDFCEIFPLWHRLGQMLPACSSAHAGTGVLLEECQQAIDHAGPEFLLSHFKRLFLAGFESALSPRLIDTEYQGIIQAASHLNPASTPLQLLKEGSALIRSLFFQETADAIRLLPVLPPAFHCGRLINVLCDHGVLDMEWTKKALRCVTFQALKPGRLSFVFTKGETQCRLRHSYKDQGTIYLNGTSLDLIPDQNYWFDNFKR